MGKIEEIYTDVQTSLPEWALVKGGLFGTRASFVPITDASRHNGTVSVPYAKDEIKGAPKVDPDGRLSEAEERALYSHYGLSYSTERSDTGLPGGGGSPPRPDDAMTRSEEELRVGTESAPAGKARLRKWVETDTETVHVPVRKERARVDREPVHEGNVEQATSGPGIAESEHEVTLHEERPVVGKQAVPKERVRLEKDLEVEGQEVSEEVRKERIDTEGDAA